MTVEAQRDSSSSDEDEYGPKCYKCASPGFWIDVVWSWEIRKHLFRKRRHDVDLSVNALLCYVEPTLVEVQSRQIWWS
jgi:hypothetical protein